MVTRTQTATHTQVANTYVGRHIEDTIFTRGGWYRYQDGVWQEMHQQEVNLEFWRLLEEFENMQQCRPTSTTLHSVMGCAKAQAYVSDEQMDSYTEWMNLANGVYNTLDGNLYPAKAEYYFTTQLPFEYDPNAGTTYWPMYLASTFTKPRSRETDLELIEFVQEAMGYSLTTDIQHHITFWCHGTGANGKGVLFHVLEQLGGSATYPLNVGLLKREQYQLASLAGKRVALCTEASAHNSLVEDAYIKALVAGDTLNVRQVYREPFILHPMVKLWWSMNELPPVADTSDGFWRRIGVVPFNRQFKEAEQIKDLKEKLDLELSGIFNWSMAGLRRLRSRGKFKVPHQVRVATAQYRRDASPVRLFIDSECEQDRTFAEASSALYSEYREWCFGNGFKARSSQRFKVEMEGAGYYREHINTGNVYTGLKLKSSLP